MVISLKHIGKAVFVGLMVTGAILLNGCASTLSKFPEETASSPLLDYAIQVQPAKAVEFENYEDGLVKALGLISYLSKPENQKPEYDGKSLKEIQAEAHFQVGLLYTNIGLDYLAFLNYETSLKYQSGDMEVIAALAESLLRMNKTEEAEKVLLDASAVDNESGILFKKLGDLYYLTGQDEIAILPYRKAIELNPEWQINPFIQLILKNIRSNPSLDITEPLLSIEHTDWTQLLSDAIDGKVSESEVVEFISDQEPKQRPLYMTEALFYIGESYRYSDPKRNKRYLQETINQKVTQFLEYAYAIALLKQRS